MDARYNVSGPARTFSDGPGVLPDADAIQPAAQQKGAPARPPAPPAAKPAATSSGGRSSLRPVHRR